MPSKNWPALAAGTRGPASGRIGPPGRRAAIRRPFGLVPKLRSRFRQSLRDFPGDSGPCRYRGPVSGCLVRLQAPFIEQNLEL
jgi:hypothetical protein